MQSFYRYKILIEYDGTPFHGWQIQKGLLSIQGLLQEAIYKFSLERVTLYGAGRTDAGVHALGQVAHFDLHKNWLPDTISDALNHYLKPHPIIVLNTELVEQNFHARFSAISRSYIYRILNRRAPPSIDANRVWHIPEVIDINKIEAASQYLIGTHDFSSFRSKQCQAKSPLKSIEQIKITSQEDEIRIFLEARSFLHNQVRIIVGNLRKVGNGKWEADKINQILQARDRCFADATAPAQGLYLYRIRY